MGLRSTANGERIARMNKKHEVGDTVWYVFGSDVNRQQAKIVAISGTTHATIKLLTGPQKDLEILVPWDVIEPLKA